MSLRSTVFLGLPAMVVVWASFAMGPDLAPPAPSTLPITWERVPLQGLAPFPGGRLTAVGFDGSGRGRAGSTQGQDFVTDDAGRTWSSRPGPAAQTTSLLRREDGLVLESVANGRIFRSTDDGSTWAEVRPPGLPIHDLVSIAGDVMLAVGDRILLLSMDAGETWSEREIPVDDQVWYDAAFATPELGYVVGGIGLLIRTSDGARTWTRSPMLASALLRGVAAIDERQAVVVGSDGLILRTGDAGMTWEVVPSGTTQHLLSVGFVDATRGVIVGLYGTVLTSTDGGRSWVRENAGTEGHLYHVAFTPDGAAVAVGWLGTIVHKNLASSRTAAP